MKPTVLVRDTHKGRGVFAARSFAPGECVLKSQGVRTPHRDPHTIQIAAHEHLMPDPPVRYLNHSCDPNLGVKSNADGLPDFYALRPIQKGDEVCFDYAMTEASLYELEHNHVEPTPCACGVPNCRGRIGHYPTLPDEVKARYRGYIAAHLLALDLDKAPPLTPMRCD